VSAAARRPWVKICGVTRPQDAERAAALGADFLGLNFWPGSPRVVDLDAAREIAAAARGAAQGDAVRLVGVFVNEAPQRVDDVAAELDLDFVQLHGDEPEAELARWGDRLVRVVRGDLLVSSPDADAGRLPTDAVGDASAAERLALKGEPGRGGAVCGDWRRLGAGRTAGEAPNESSPPGTTTATLGPGRLSLQQNASVSVSTPLSVVFPFAYLLDTPRATLGGYGGKGVAWDWASARSWVAAAPRPVLVAGGVRPGNAAEALAASGAAGVDVASGVESAPGVKDAEKMRRLFEEVRGVAT
jgi:phosphoribosylanthranilate isomerase